MPTTPTVPAPLPLGTVHNVELVHTGTWEASTGTVTFTVEDLAAAVGALDCPAVRRPFLKLGHTPDPAPGQPAIGFVANMATADNGRTLVGDFVGMPGWLVVADAEGRSVLSSAYPDRSIEGMYGFRCQMGHTHPFVITAVALLGAEQPAVGTLQSLQDLADLFGVSAMSGADSNGAPFFVATHVRGVVMPEPNLLQVSASVSTEDVRRAFYASPVGAGWSKWVEEIQLDPMQLIVMDDETNTRSRVPVVIGDGDGQEAVSFGDPVPVVIRYDDAAVAASASVKRVLFASRAVSRIAAQTSKSPTAPAVRIAQERGAGMDPAKLREAFGLPADASDEDVTAAWTAGGLVAASVSPPDDKVPAAPAAPTRANDGTIRIDASAWEEREERIKRLEAAAAKRAREERDDVITEAIRAGKFPPARRDHWVRLWDADSEGTRAVLASLAKNVVPVEQSGSAFDDDAEDAEFAHLFPPAPKARA